MGRPRGPDRKVSGDGYVVVRVPPDERARHSVRKDGWMAEHRYLMEKWLDRILEEDEQVHHVNEDKLDNRRANLEVRPAADHAAYHYLSRYG